MKARIIIAILAASSLLSGTGCNKDNLNNQLGIPFVQVDQYVLLNAPSGFSLTAVGGWAYVEAGSRGIVVYHRGFEDYVAFDRHCTWQTTESCGKVSVDSSNIFLSCACCDSRFSLIDGSVINAPAVNPLLQYRAQISTPGILHVWN